MNNRFLTKFLLLFCTLLLQGIQLLAQGDPGPDPDIKVPFDGGLSLLIAAGIGYGAKKAYDQRKKAQGSVTENKE